MCDNLVASENSSEKMDTSDILVKNEPRVEDEECDSNFVIRRHKPVKPNDENSNQHVSSSNLANKQQMPPLSAQKPCLNNTSPPKMMLVKPKSSSSSSSTPSTAVKQPRHLDKIVNNLKINLLQQMSKNQTSIVKHEEKKEDLFIKIVESLKNSKSTENPDDYDDLTDLSWLTTFNLSKEMGPQFALGCCLSPPQSPTSLTNTSTPKTQQLHINTVTKPRSNHTLNVAPAKINPKFISSTSFDLKYGDDEADGCSSILKSQPVDISSLIKPWLPAQQKTLATTHQSPQRPPYSFSCLTFLAIESSERKRLSVKEIYAWIIQHFPYYHSVPSGSWKNSIRHNLSYNQCFSKVDKNLLAMRDFSGKGSLWCINPEFRPLLVEMLHKTPTHEQHKLACIPFLQDVAESVNTSTSNTSSLLSINSPSKSSLTYQGLPNNNNANNSAQKASQQFKKRSNTQPCVPTVINPKIISQLHHVSSATSTSSINQAPLVYSTKKSVQNMTSMPRVSSVYKNVGKINTMSNNINNTTRPSLITQTSAPTKGSSNNSVISFAGNYSEIDAVNALLTMKSRSSSMPAVGASTSPVSDLHQNEQTAKKGRRKQILRPPTKNLMDKPLNNYYEDESSLDLNSDNSEDRLTNYSSDRETSKSKNSKKLLIKFPSFKNSSKSSKTTEEITSNYININANDDDDSEGDDDDDEEHALKIDESFHEDLESSSDISDHDDKIDISSAKKRKLNNHDNNSNALLELSRAATLVEEKKQTSKQ